MWCVSEETGLIFCEIQTAVKSFTMAKMLGVEERTDLRRASLISEIYSETHTSGFPGRARPKRPGLGGKFGKLGKLKKCLDLLLVLRRCHFILSGSQF